jgi:hypothetical protein
MRVRCRRRDGYGCAVPDRRRGRREPGRPHGVAPLRAPECLPYPSRGKRCPHGEQVGPPGPVHHRQEELPALTSAAEATGILAAADHADVFHPFSQVEWNCHGFKVGGEHLCPCLTRNRAHDPYRSLTGTDLLSRGVCCRPFGDSCRLPLHQRGTARSAAPSLARTGSADRWLRGRYPGGAPARACSRAGAPSGLLWERLSGIPEAVTCLTAVRGLRSAAVTGTAHGSSGETRSCPRRSSP